MPLRCKYCGSILDITAVIKWCAYCMLGWPVEEDE